jgi:hypothetical protein
MKPLTTAAVAATAVALSAGVARAGDRRDLRQDRRELARDVRQ